MQHLIDCFANSCLVSKSAYQRLKLCSLQLQSKIDLNIQVNRIKLETDKAFVYLGCTLERYGSLDFEIFQRTQRATDSFVKPKKRATADRSITRKTKVSIYKACELTALLYS